MKAKILFLFLSIAGICFGQAALPYNAPIVFGSQGGGGTGGGGTPGGSNGDFQYNNAGTFGGYSLVAMTNLIFAQTITTINATTVNVTALEPASNDGAALGSTSKQFSDLFLAEGGVINWDNGDATITQAGDVVTVAGAALANSSPGTAANSVATIDGTQNLTNKAITPRITTITSSGTPTFNTDSADCVTITAQAAAITSMTSSRTGTINNFQQLEIRIKDDGTARAITWGADYSSGIATLPTTTILGKTLVVYLEGDTVTGDFMCQSVGSYP